MTRTVYPATVNPPVRASCRRVETLDGEWSLRLDPEDRGVASGWVEGEEPFAQSVRVPGCVNAVSEFGDDYPSYTMPNAYSGSCWYRRRFALPSDWAAERTWLHFGGIMPTARVWLNGQLQHSLDAAREAVPPGLHRIPASPGDDPVILETWL